ncbi:MAG: hypothetical protein COC19_03740 [SAR86 cluster bacterium]|uniref:VWFA domain-containing protein n=1 Tax=SAR86 cluster bacterium TaxID=2030880 RepID=A0A2A4MPB4_9GAMM|nr:MAG: hypothetical protein COC19_03740 [SAR86 cluster bacterium]
MRTYTQPHLGNQALLISQPRWLCRSTLMLALVCLSLVGCNSKQELDRVNQSATNSSTVDTAIDTNLNTSTDATRPRAEVLVLDSNQEKIESVIVTGSYVRSGRDIQGLPAPMILSSPSLASTSYMISDPSDYYYPGEEVNRENYLEVEENAIKVVSQSPVSTFSIDVDTAAYSNLRRMLMAEGRLPPNDAVRLEEMINYFDYDYAPATSMDQPLAVHTELATSPWNAHKQLLMIGIKGFEPAASERANANLVFLVDVSGSMQSDDKLGLVKKSLKLLVSQLNEQDRIALVVYAGAAGVVLKSTSASKQREIFNAIDSLHAGGSTNGEAGISLAYQIAEENFIEDGLNRVIIASDGDLNVGLSGIDELKEMISRKRQNGVALSTLGFGSGNYNYSLMEQLADVGNGSAAYIDGLNEARKVLVEQLQATLVTIAKDVKIQIEFNPDVVSEYRLIGYENRVLAQEDFLNDRVDAGEIGAGHTVTALYEIGLTGSQGNLISPSRYSQADSEPGNLHAAELAFVKIRYKLNGTEKSTQMEVAVLNQQVTNDIQEASDNFRFAAAVAGFGQLLQGGKYTNELSYNGVLELARMARGQDIHGYRSEFLNMVELAKVL